MDEKLIHHAKEYIGELMEKMYDGHDPRHSYRVCRIAMHIAKSEIEKGNEVDMTLVALIALLHHADDEELVNSVDYGNTRGFLAKEHVSEEMADKIIRGISQISYEDGPEPEQIEVRIVQDADNIDAIGAIGIARAFAFGGYHRKNFRKSVETCYEKLDVRDGMLTEEGRRIATERQGIMIAFLKEFDKNVHIFKDEED